MTPGATFGRDAVGMSCGHPVEIKAPAMNVVGSVTPLAIGHGQDNRAFWYYD